MNDCTHKMSNYHSAVCLKCKREAKRRMHRRTLEVLTDDAGD